MSKSLKLYQLDCLDCVSVTDIAIPQKLEVRKFVSFRELGTDVHGMSVRSRE